MGHYFFLSLSLPELSLESPPELSFNELLTLIKDNVSHRDYRQVMILLGFYDLLNLRSFWKKEELDPHGLMNELELEEALLTQSGLPEYIYEFTFAHQSIEERLEHFPSLISQFFKLSSQETRGFLKNYYAFERDWRLVFSGFRAKKLGRDLSIELQYEDPEEELIAQMLAQKDAKTFVPPEKYQELKTLFEKNGDDPLALEKALDEYRMNYIDTQLSMTDIFSIEYVLAYLAKFIIIEKWFQLDAKKGAEIIDTIVKETK